MENFYKVYFNLPSNPFIENTASFYILEKLGLH